VIDNTSAERAALTPSLISISDRDPFGGARMISVAQLDGEHIAALEFSVITARQFLEHPIVASNFNLSTDMPPFQDPDAHLTILGSLSSNVGGVQYGAKIAGDLIQVAAREVIKLAMSSTATRSPHSIAVNVPSDQVEMFERSANIGSKEIFRHSQYHLDIPRGVNEDEFLTSLNARDRRTWMMDVRADLGMDAPAGVEDPREIRDEIAPMIADVRSRNGVQTHAVLVEHELELWERKHPSARVAFTRRSGDGALVAACLASIDGGQLHLYDVGLLSDSDQRGVLYRLTVFLQPLRFAIAHGLSRVHFGYGHDLPKKSRGAVGTSMHTLVMTNDHFGTYSSPR